MNQTGVVYCRDSDELTSQHASQSATIIAGKAVVLTETTELSHSSSSGRVKHQDKSRSNLKDSTKQRGTESTQVGELLLVDKTFMLSYFCISSPILNVNF